MLGLVGCSMAQPWGKGKCAGSNTHLPHRGSNLGSEEKLGSPLSMGINGSSPRAEPCPCTLEG